MLSLLYCRTREIGKMAGFVTRQEALGNRVVIRNSARFDDELELKLGAQVVEQVYVTEVSMRVMSAYLEAGLPVEVLSSGPRPIPTLPDLRAPASKPGPTVPEDPNLPPGYSILKTPRGWVKVSLDGTKVARAFQGKGAEEKARQAAWDHFMEVSGG